jgi:hypothetical protein
MKCNKCGFDIIEEESSNHTCFTGRIRKVRFDSDTPHLVTIFDGQKWLKCPNLKPYQPKVNTDNITDKETEPVIRFCYLVG